MSPRARDASVPGLRADFFSETKTENGRFRRGTLGAAARWEYSMGIPDRGRRSVGAWRATMWKGKTGNDGEDVLAGREWMRG